MKDEDDEIEEITPPEMPDGVKKMLDEAAETIKKTLPPDFLSEILKEKNEK